MVAGVRLLRKMRGKKMDLLSGDSLKFLEYSGLKDMPGVKHRATVRALCIWSLATMKGTQNLRGGYKSSAGDEII